MNKREVVLLVEDWYHEREFSIVSPQHVLVSVQEGHLKQGPGVAGKETRPQGRSRPPIRDMKGIASRVDRIMSHLRLVDRLWYDTLKAYAVLGSIRLTAESTGEKYESTRGNINSAVAVFMSGAIFLPAKHRRERF